MRIFEAFRRNRTPRHERGEFQAEQTTGEAPPGETGSEPYGNEQHRRPVLLTPRERELFLLLLEGYTLKESAKQLSVKYSTANTHMTSIYKKLNVNSRAELIIRYRDAVKRNE